MEDNDRDQNQGMVTALFVVLAMFAAMCVVVSSVEGAEYTVTVERASAYTVTIEAGEKPVARKPPVEPGEPTRPVIYVFYAPFRCPPCEDQKAVMKAWKDAPFDVGKLDKSPVSIPSYPFTIWRGSNGQWRYIEGWRGKKDLVERWKATQSEPSRTSVESSTRTTTSIRTGDRAIRLKQFANSYRGQTTPVKGMTYRQHLMDWRHGFTASELAGLSEHELERLHSACHHYGWNAATLRAYAARNGIQ